MALTATQIAEFKTAGYVVVRNLIAPSVLHNWRAQIRAKFGALSDAQKAVGSRPQHRADIAILRGFRFSPRETQLVQQLKVKAIVDQVGGGQFCGEDGNLRLLWPEPHREWRLPDRGHIDGYLGKRRTMPFLLGLATYLYDVEARGGGTVFWPGSHLASWKFLRKHPDHLDRSFKQHPEYLAMIEDIQPVEVPAKAGDVIFWHCNILHETSHNVSNHIRYGLFARLPHKDQDVFRDEIPDDLWKRWRI